MSLYLSSPGHGEHFDVSYMCQLTIGNMNMRGSIQVGSGIKVGNFLGAYKWKMTPDCSLNMRAFFFNFATLSMFL